MKYNYCPFQGKSYLKILIISFLILSLVSSRGSAQDESVKELNVVTGKWLDHTDAPNSMYKHLAGQAYELLNYRKDSLEAFQNLEQWQNWQVIVRRRFSEILGPFPEKTPLNAKIVRTVKKEGYRVEHIIFESQPGFYVTSSLFIPDSQVKGKKAPTIVYCSGHTELGYRSPVYQHVMLNLVKKGFIVYAFDPVGQGERLEYFDPETGKSIVGGPTMEHSYPGAQAFITGSSQARYMIWDGIRAVDYLLTRKEVDPARIGITGRSGGGTQSAHIAAVDDRIYAVAPENYITNYERLLQSIGPQDAEQNMFNMIGRGLDHPDFLIVRAPKPALMITTTDDMFSIQGAMETEKEVSRIYGAYDKQENFSRSEDNAPHASTLKNREALYAFFQEHLKNPGNPQDEKTVILTPEELRVTETGQLSTSVKGETVFSLNKKETEKRLSGLKKKGIDQGYFILAAASAKKLSGYRDPAEIQEPVYSGRIVRDSYIIERYFLKGEGNYIIPYLLFKPQNAVNNAVIYLHPSGKNAEAGIGGEIEKFVNEGITVLAPDLLGTGEMGPGTFEGDAYFSGASHNLWYASMLTGRTITGIHAGDVVRLARLLNKYGFSNISGISRKEMSPVLLHAASFSPEIRSVVLIEPYSSYLSLVVNRFYDPHFILSSVPHSIGSYDLPDLAASLAPRKLLISGMTDGNGKTTDNDAINSDLEVIRSTYTTGNAEDNLRILPGDADQNLIEHIIEWLK